MDFSAYPGESRFLCAARVRELRELLGLRVTHGGARPFGAPHLLAACSGTRVDVVGLSA